MSRPVEPEPPKVPAYIVTFSDMVTLLLTFFVMLLTLAQVQDPELFDSGRDAFFNHINSFGLGMLTGRSSKSDFGKVKLKYYTDTDEPDTVRTIDSSQQDIREVFKKLSKAAQPMRSELASEAINFAVMGIDFSPNSSKLNPQAHNFLEKYVSNFVRSCPSASSKLYIAALSDNDRDVRKRWTLSANRAMAVKQKIKSLFPEGYICPIFTTGTTAETALFDVDIKNSGSKVYIAVLHN